MHRGVYAGVLTILTVLSLSSGDYVRSGSNITDCSLNCSHTDVVLELYRECGGDERRLLELWCDNMWHINHYEPRLQYNTGSGCWTLTDAGKDDSCVYKVLYHGKGGRFQRTLPITVLDPVLISTITSNCSRLGEDIAVSVQFSGEETAVTWEVDGGLLPDRYRLIDDNRTLIILSAQRDDAGRRLSVRITNPVSEETREYQLEITDPQIPRSRGFLAVVGLMVILVIVSGGVFLYQKEKKKSSRDEEMKMMNDHSEENGRPPRSRSESGAVIFSVLFYSF